MNIMEFDELQQIWDTQNNKPLFAINERALHNRILSKMRKTRHITNASEFLLIIVNLGVGCFILGVNLYKQHSNMFLYGMAAWMFATFLYSLVSRIRRIKSNRRFDRSMHGDLDHAIAVANYQVRLSQVMRWNIVPIGILSLLSIWESGKSFWIAGAILILFILAFYGGLWENNIYKARKRELEILKEKLETKD
jgi:hypothetical protein